MLSGKDWRLEIPAGSAQIPFVNVINVTLIRPRRAKVTTHISAKIKSRRQPAILKGAATLTFDQTMLNHRFKSDWEALESDWVAICRDMHEALKVAKPQYELDAA